MNACRTYLASVAALLAVTGASGQVRAAAPVVLGNVVNTTSAFSFGGLSYSISNCGYDATSAFGSAAQEITGKQIFQPTSPYNTVVEALATSETSTSLARRLWYSFAHEGEQVLHQEDFEEVLGNTEEAREAMLLFDRVLPILMRLTVGWKWRH